MFLTVLLGFREYLIRWTEELFYLWLKGIIINVFLYCKSYLLKLETFAICHRTLMFQVCFGYFDLMFVFSTFLLYNLMLAYNLFLFCSFIDLLINLFFVIFCACE